MRLIDADNANIEEIGGGYGCTMGSLEVEEWLMRQPTIDPASLVNQWISVKDRLPEETGYYMVCCAGSPNRGVKNGSNISYYQHKSKNWNRMNNDYVTHWLPLPSPPEEEQQ